MIAVLPSAIGCKASAANRGCDLKKIEVIRVSQPDTIVNKHLNDLLAFALVACPRTAETSNPYAILGGLTSPVGQPPSTTNHHATRPARVTPSTLAGRFFAIPQPGKVIAIKQTASA
jgi:hypothetical protein